MPDLRIVFNQQRGLYRLERRRWWGWEFVLDRSGEDYASFSCYEDAVQFVCKHLRRQPPRHRRWKVVDICDQRCQSC